MSVQLGRYIIRMIHGKLTPIRIGKEAITNASNYSRKALKKLNLLLKNRDILLNKQLEIRKKIQFSPTQQIYRFMKKTGAIRTHATKDSLSLDLMTKPTSSQMQTLRDMSINAKDVMADSPKGSIETHSVDNAISKLKGLFESPRTKTADIIEGNAIKRYGETYTKEFSGYVNRKGQMLNFHQGSGMRDLDHRDISDLLPSSKLVKLKPHETRTLISQEARYAKVKRSEKHEAHNLYREIIKAQDLKESDNLFPVKEDILKSLMSKLQGKWGWSDKSNSEKWLNKLKKRKK